MKKLYDLNEEEEFGNASVFDESNTSDMQPPEQIISGLGIENEDEVQEEELNALLKMLNSGTDQAMAEDVRRQEEERERYRQEEERRLKEVQDKYNRERFEKEQAAKAERLKKEAEEEARALEEEKTKRSGFFGKFANISNKDDKNAKKEQKNLLKQDLKQKKEKEKEEKANKKEEEKRQKLESDSLKKAQEELLAKEQELAKKERELEEKAKEHELFIKQREQEFLQSEEDFSDFPDENMDSFDVPDDVDFIFEGNSDIDLSEDIEEHEVQEKEEEQDQEYTIGISYGTLLSWEKNKEKISDSSSLEVKENDEISTKEEPVSEVKKSKKGFSISSLFSKKEKNEKSTVSNPEPVENKEEPDWKYIANHDEMTSLLNSRAYAEDLKTMPSTFAVVFFDINNLKYINDNFSHGSGDKVIKAVASCIQKEFGENCSYRTGGDEFVVLLEKPAKNASDVIQKKSNNIHEQLKQYAKKDSENIPYAVSIGYAFGDGTKSKEDVIKIADASMYRNKKAYSDSHPEYAVRSAAKKEKAKESPEKNIDHDDLLRTDQRNLKEKIRENHRIANENSTEKIVREVQKRRDEVNAILIASPTFDHLFIIRDVDDFLNIVMEQECLIDYSYLYVVYDGGPQYYGSDEYYTEVTHIFEPIAEGLLSGRFRSEKDIRAIKGINIFRQVFI